MLKPPSTSARPPSSATSRWRNSNRVLRHVIEPELTYRFVAGIGARERNVLLVDTTDIATDTNEAGYSLTQRFYLRPNRRRSTLRRLRRQFQSPSPCPAKPREWASWQIAQKFFFDPNFGGALIPNRRNVFDSTLDLTGVAFLTAPRNLSPLISRMRFEAIDNLRIEWDLDFDPKSGRLQSDNLFAGYSWGSTTIGLGHATAQCRRRKRQRPPLIQSQQLQPFLSIGKQTRVGFNLAANAGYDFVQNSLQYAGVQAVYNWNCCGLTFGYRRFELGSHPRRNAVPLQLHAGQLRLRRRHPPRQLRLPRPHPAARLLTDPVNPLRSTHRQQFLEEPANPAFPVDKVNLQNPVPLLPLLIERPHRQTAVRMNVERHLIAGNLFMRKLPDQVPRNPSAELPSELLRKRDHMCKKLVGRDLRRLVEVSPPLRKRRADIVPQFELLRIGPDHERPPEIRLAVLKDRSEIEKKNVVLADCQVRWILVVGRKRVPARANDALVPIRRNAVHFFGQCVDFFIQPALADAGTNQAPFLIARKSRSALSWAARSSVTRCSSEASTGWVDSDKWAAPHPIYRAHGGFKPRWPLIANGKRGC